MTARILDVKSDTKNFIGLHPKREGVEMEDSSPQSGGGGGS